MNIYTLWRRQRNDLKQAVELYMCAGLKQLLPNHTILSGAWTTKSTTCILVINHWVFMIILCKMGFVFSKIFVYSYFFFIVPEWKQNVSLFPVGDQVGQNICSFIFWNNLLIQRKEFKLPLLFPQFAVLFYDTLHS